MKVILSRKGFDSSYGGMPSPIMPNGELLSIPIPSKNDSICFTDISIGDQTLFQLIKQLKPKTKIKETYRLHLDPDLRSEWIPRSIEWKPVFGQQNQSLSHLENQGVGIGDIFLFFGWFRKSEEDQNGTLRFVPNAPDLHVVYGYLQIGQIFRNMNRLPESYLYHPHSKYSISSNCIYEAAQNLSVDERFPGSGVFSYDKSLVLTKKGETRSKWDLPEAFKMLSISYHTKASFSNGIFHSAKKGQEFVFEDNQAVEQWALNIIKKGTSPNRC